MDKLNILFDKLTLSNMNDPDKAWNQLKNSIKKHKLEIISLDTPILPNKVLIFKLLVS